MSRLVKKPARILFACIVFTGCIGCDQATKHIATQTLPTASPQSYFADTIRLQYVQNPGGFLSLGGNLSPRVRFWFFIVINAVFLAVVAYVLWTRWSMHSAKFYSLVTLLAGGIGNLIDRIAHNGLVTDFLNLGIGPIRTGIFNVADVAVLFGTLTLFFVCREKRAE